MHAPLENESEINPRRQPKNKIRIGGRRYKTNDIAAAPVEFHVATRSCTP
jgi:hypothetical protein